jgi:hypothetical protein
MKYLKHFISIKANSRTIFDAAATLSLIFAPEHYLSKNLKLEVWERLN